MKKITIYTLLGICALSSGQVFGQSKITGKLTGIKSDTLLIQTYPAKDRSNPRMDTIALKNGSFVLPIKSNELMEGYMYAKPSLKPDANGRIPAASMKGIQLVLLPGQSLDITGTLDDYKFGGSSFYKEINVLNQSCKVYKNKIDSITNICTALQKSGVSNDSIGKVYAQARPWIQAIQKIKREYVQQHLDKDVAVYVLSQLSRNDVGDFINKLSEPVKSGVMAPMYQRLKDMYDKEMARNKAKEAVVPGKPAPEFTLKDLNGKDFSLSSLKGKYVVLDFWGSWCGWCIKGIPEMKKSYEKYKGKVEFVGIDCNDTEKKWKDAVAKYELPWINVRNADGPDVSVMYAVSGYPTKYIIDPEGKIVKAVIGEDPAFYTFLEELLK